jgi:diketogulonate reductase-like aldo/keto reductase
MRKAQLANERNTEMTQVPLIELSDGAKIPQLGFGTWQIDPEDAGEAVTKALDVGYRAIDTAAAYENEAEVGGAINGSAIDRSELFVTTKLWNDSQGADATKAAFEESLSKLGLDYLDLYLIHWPAPDKGLFVETWKAMEELRADGRVRSIGVSNFREEDLERLAQETDTVPVLNQIELHPALQQRGLREVHSERGIVTEAWSPLAQGELFEDEALTGIAEANSKSAAQVMLRWQMQLGNVTIPKSVTADRIEANFDIWDFELSDEDMAAIEGLDKGRRTGPDPSEFS